MDASLCMFHFMHSNIHNRYKAHICYYYIQCGDKAMQDKLVMKPGVATLWKSIIMKCIKWDHWTWHGILCSGM